MSDELVDALYLVGDEARIRDNFAKWKESPITTMLVGTPQIEAVRLLAELNAE